MSQHKSPRINDTKVSMGHHMQSIVHGEHVYGDTMYYRNFNQFKLLENDKCLTIDFSLKPISLIRESL